MAIFTVDTRPGGDGYKIKTLQGCDLTFVATLPEELQGANYDLYIMDIEGNEKISITSADGDITETSGNRHYRAYQKWVAEGNTPIPERPGDAYELIDDEWVLNLDKAKEAKKAEIASARYDAETGGLEVNGVTIDTSRDSQALLIGAVIQALQDPEYTLNWKTTNGWVTLDATTIIAIGTAVRQHVQACFDREEELSGQVDEATTEEEIDAISW
jgi:hypothetical protein